MNKKVLALLVVSFLISVLASASAGNLVKASSMLLPGYPANIYVQSPQNQTYNVRTVPLNFTVESYNQEHFPTVYIIGNQSPVPVDTHMVSSRVVAVPVWSGWSSEPNQTENHVLYTLEGRVVLETLVDGTYNVTVQRFLSDGKTVVNATTVCFTVDASDSELIYTGKEDPFLYVLAAFVVTIALVSAGLLVYFKKIKH